MAEHQTLPVLPMGETVLFPGITIPIVAGQPGDAAGHRGRHEVRWPDLRRHAEGARRRAGRRRVVVRGRRRGPHRADPARPGGRAAPDPRRVPRRAIHYHQAEGYLKAEVAAMAEMGPIDERDTAFAALYRETRERARELGAGRGMPEEVIKNVLDSVTEPESFRRPRGRPSRAARRREPVAPGDPGGGGAPPSRAGPRPAPDRRAQRPGRDQDAGAGGAGRASARDVPPRAAQGDPEGAGRGRPVARADRAPREDPRARPAQGGPRRGRARARAAGALGTRVDGGPGHPHLPRMGRGAPLGHAVGRQHRPRQCHRASSTRTTTA